MPAFKAQFIGRFAYLFGRDGNVSIVAPKMSGDEPPMFKPHAATLTIPSRFVLFGDEHALRVVTIPGEKFISTFMVWDLDGMDVEFGDYKGGGVQQAFEPVAANGGPGVPDLLDLGKGPAAARVRSEIVTPLLPKGVPVTARISIGGGRLAPMPTASINPNAVDFYAFRPFNDKTPLAANEPVMKLVDGVEWRGETVNDPKDPLSASGLTIRLRRFDGAVDRKIVCRPSPELELGFGHSCNCTTQIDRDEEFVAYYKLLETPPDLAARPIPVLKPDPPNALICGASPDCQGIVRASV